MKGANFFKVNSSAYGVNFRIYSYTIWKTFLTTESSTCLYVEISCSKVKSNRTLQKLIPGICNMTELKLFLIISYLTCIYFFLFSLMNVKQEIFQELKNVVEHEFVGIKKAEKVKLLIIASGRYFILHYYLLM